MKELQELRNEILTLRNFGVINKEEEKSLLTKLNSVKEQFAICGVGWQSEQLKDEDIPSLNEWIENLGYKQITFSYVYKKEGTYKGKEQLAKEYKKEFCL